MIPWGSDYDHRATRFACETCGYPLHRVMPSNMLVCLTPTCTADEPLFLVGVDDD
jgi:hypothetical protein